jgi:cell division control protein 6
VGRETEKNRIQEFIKERLRKGLGGALYVSGAPGTGKTASLKEIVANLNILQKAKKKTKISKEQDPMLIPCSLHFINCMELKQPWELLARILHIENQEVSSAQLQAEFQRFVKSDSNQLS